MALDIPGDLLIRLALGFDLIVIAAFILAARGRQSLVSLGRRGYHLVTICAMLASAWLFWLFLSHQFQTKYVFEYSDSTLGVFYLISAFWAGQEGTYLLWWLLSALFGYVVLHKGGRYRDTAMAVHGVINLFLLVLLLKLSPFRLLGFNPSEGAGLNPLLIDPWMVIHPPVVFIGYAMAGVPFALAVAALIRRDFSDWLPRVFPWVAVTAVALGAGNILGGFWAYKTLGWGGYWAWDPVENSSLIPWLATLALIHGLIVEKRSGALRRTNLLLTIYVFVLVVYGTFLTRSGVLADFSVHSFVDLGQNIYLVLFLVLFAAGSLGLFLWRAAGMESRPLNYNVFGREFVLLAATVLLFLLSFVVLFWTSLPFLTSVLASQPRAADMSTYNAFALPLAVLYALLISFAPWMDYGSYHPHRFGVRLGAASGAMAAVSLACCFWLPGGGFTFAVLLWLVGTGVSAYLMKPGAASSLLWGGVTLALAAAAMAVSGMAEPLHVLFIAVGALAVGSSLARVLMQVTRQWRASGPAVSHLGFAMMMIGVLASSVYVTDDRLVLPRGADETAAGVSLAFNGMRDDIMTPRNELILTLDDGAGAREVRPRLYYSERLDGIMRNPYIDRTLWSDLYLAPQQILEPESPDALTLSRGESVQLGDLTVRFDGFEAGDHARTGADMRINARVVIDREGVRDTLRPGLEIVAEGSSHSRPLPRPDTLAADSTVIVTVQRVLADEGAVVLNVAGSGATAAPETLVLEVSRKPLINMVWLGAVLILAGGVIAFVRRHGELPA